MWVLVLIIKHLCGIALRELWLGRWIVVEVLLCAMMHGVLLFRSCSGGRKEIQGAIRAHQRALVIHLVYGCVAVGNRSRGIGERSNRLVICQLRELRVLVQSSLWVWVGSKTVATNLLIHLRWLLCSISSLLAELWLAISLIKQFLLLFLCLLLFCDFIFTYQFLSLFLELISSLFSPFQIILHLLPFALLLF